MGKRALKDYAEVVLVPIWLTVVMSAGVGAIASSLFVFLDHVFERKSRREELALAKAIDLARGKMDLTLALAKEQGQPVKVYDVLSMAEDYFRWTQHLLNHG